MAAGRDWHVVEALLAGGANVHTYNKVCEFMVGSMHPTTCAECRVSPLPIYMVTPVSTMGTFLSSKHRAILALALLECVHVHRAAAVLLRLLFADIQ